jgi:hypothetical protein
LLFGVDVAGASESFKVKVAADCSQGQPHNRRRKTMNKPVVYIAKRDQTVYGLREPTTVEIVCGDCSLRRDSVGNAELLPIRTLLSSDGRCYTCGGSSYVIASELCGTLCRTIRNRREAELSFGGGHETRYTTSTAFDHWMKSDSIGEDERGSTSSAARKVAVGPAVN